MGQPDLSFEQELWSLGVSRIAGLDEAGRGAWAGPVMAAAVILPQRVDVLATLHGARDSKQLTHLEREHWAGEIRQVALAWAVGWADASEIDEIGILPATRQAMLRALAGLAVSVQYLLIDYIKWPKCPAPHQMLIKGDDKSLSIACASILAKTARDKVMQELDGQYPGYGFAGHKGYGTAQHRQALSGLGTCPAHRKSYRLGQP